MLRIHSWSVVRVPTRYIALMSARESHGRKEDKKSYVRWSNKKFWVCTLNIYIFILIKMISAEETISPSLRKIRCTSTTCLRAMLGVTYLPSDALPHWNSQTSQPTQQHWSLKSTISNRRLCSSFTPSRILKLFTTNFTRRKRHCWSSKRRANRTRKKIPREIRNYPERNC